MSLCDILEPRGSRASRDKKKQNTNVNMIILGFLITIISEGPRLLSPSP